MISPHNVSIRGSSIPLIPLEDLPVSKDWEAMLTPVKDQGNCGSCWVHAAVEQVEAYAKIAGASVEPLSVQQVTSCQTLVTGAGNCNGGNFPYAANYIEKSGLMTESSYPYKSGSLGCGFGGRMGSDDFCVTKEMGSTGRCLSVPNHCPVSTTTGLKATAKVDKVGGCFDGQCNTDYFGCCLTQLYEELANTSAAERVPTVSPLTDMPINSGAQCLYDSGKASVKIKGYGSVPAYNEDAMQSWLAQHGPLQISIDASDLQHYKSGVLTSCTAGPIDHDVQLVGYGVDNGVQYWRIRNSWAESWGEAGFFRVKRGVNACNMASEVSGYPEM